MNVKGWVLLLVFAYMNMGHIKVNAKRDRGKQWKPRSGYKVWGLRYKPRTSWIYMLQLGRSRVQFRIMSLGFFIDLILLATLWPWSWLSLQQKWVPGVCPGGKRRLVHKADNLATFMCRMSRYPGSFNLLEPKGPVHDCTGIAVPLEYEAEVLTSQPHCSVNCNVYYIQMHYINSLTQNMWWLKEYCVKLCRFIELVTFCQNFVKCLNL